MSVVYFGINTPVGGQTPTITPAPPPGVPNGAMMLMQVSSNVNVSPLVSLVDWSLVDSEASGTSNIFIYSRIATASEPATYTVTRTGSTSDYCAAIMAWTSDAGRALYVDAHANQANVSSTNTVFPGVTTTQASAGLACFANLDSNLSLTPDAAMDERIDALVSFNRIYLMTQVLTVAGATGTRTATRVTGTGSRVVTVAVAETAITAFPLSTGSYYTQYPWVLFR